MPWFSVWVGRFVVFAKKRRCCGFLELRFLASRLLVQSRRRPLLAVLSPFQSKGYAPIIRNMIRSSKPLRLDHSKLPLASIWDFFSPLGDRSRSDAKKRRKSCRSAGQMDSCFGFHGERLAH